MQNVRLCMDKMSKLLITENEELLEKNKANYQYLKFYKHLMERKLDFDRILKFKDYSIERKYFNLQIKSILLIIRYYIQNKDWIMALEVIEEGQSIINDKFIITLEIELILLKTVVLANQCAFKAAWENYVKAELVVKKHELNYYKKRIFKINELIKNAEESVSSLFNIIKEKGENFEEEKVKILKNSEMQLISKETILDYLERSLRIVTQI